MLNLREDQGASPHHVVVAAYGSRQPVSLFGLNPARKLEWRNQRAGYNFILAGNENGPKPNTAASEHYTINNCPVMAAAVSNDDTLVILVDHEVPSRKLKGLLVGNGQ